MPRIPDEYLNSVIYLYASVEHATHGVDFGGTGFLVGVPSARHRAWRHVVAVTCRHVVTETPSADHAKPPAQAAPVIRINTSDGSAEVLPLKTEDWIFDKSQDIAVTVLPLSGQYSVHLVPSERFITDQVIRMHRVGLGDDVFMLGRFINHDGKQRNAPSARFGYLAMMPNEPAFHESNQPQKQESFFVDVRAIGGYSGSPVFLPFDQLLKHSSGEFFTQSFPPPGLDMSPFLLGVEWGYILDHEENNTGMSGVVPAWKLADLINSNKVRAVMDQADDLIDRHYSGGTALAKDAGL